MKPERHLPALLLASSLALTACTAPDAKPKVAPLAATAVGLGAAPAPAVSESWWKALGDSQLDRIIGDALAANPDLDAALARIHMAEATVSGAQSVLAPQLSAGGDTQVQRLSGAYTIPPPYGGSVRSIGNAQANFGWTLDFWGRQADAIRQARAGVDASLLDREAARQALAAGVVQTYVELSRAERLIEVADAAVTRQDELLKLARLRRDSRLASDIDVRSAETLATAARQQALRAREQREAVVHALAQLAGRGADYYAGIGQTALQPGDALALPAALPADLLARRPDILAAKARITAATAGQQVAAKAYYPNINLTGLVGLQALGLDNLFTGRAFTSGAGAALHLPIFDGGRIRAEYAGAGASLDAAIAGYNGAVLAAVREAADALTGIRRLDADIEAQHRVESGLADLRRMDDSRVAAGLGARSDLIGAELRLLDARQQAANLQADRVIARVRLMAAIGGGFAAGVEAANTETRTSR